MPESRDRQKKRLEREQRERCVESIALEEEAFRVQLAPSIAAYSARDLAYAKGPTVTVDLAALRPGGKSNGKARANCCEVDSASLEFKNLDWSRLQMVGQLHGSSARMTTMHRYGCCA
jgi:hypothetical protein